MGPQDWTSVAGCTVDGAPTLKCLEAVFGNIVSVVISLAGIALFVMLSVGAFRYLTSGGEPKATEAAQKTMTSAFLGIILIIASYLILSLVSEFTGISLLKFEIPTF
jgi:hypothetical protein